MCNALRRTDKLLIWGYYVIYLEYFQGKKYTVFIVFNGYGYYKNFHVSGNIL